MARMLFFGAGGVGTTYLNLAHRGGAHVTAVCRSNYAAAKENGFQLRSKIFGNLHVKPDVVRQPADAKGPFDFVFVCSKVTVGKTPSTPDLIRPAVGASTAIVLCQNGIGGEQEYVDAFPDNPIFLGVVHLFVTEVEPAVTVHSAVELLEIGAFPIPASAAAQKAVNDVAKIWAHAGATCKVVDDIRLPRWSKLLVNAAWNPSCALTLRTDADFLRSSSASEAHIRGIMQEINAVAKSEGVDGINDATIEGHLERARQRLVTGGSVLSMLTDVRNGRSMEIEAILGNTVRIAAKNGVSVPRLETMYALGKGLNAAIEHGQRVGPPPA